MGQGGCDVGGKWWELGEEGWELEEKQCSP